MTLPRLAILVAACGLIGAACDGGGTADAPDGAAAADTSDTSPPADAATADSGPGDPDTAAPADTNQADTTPPRRGSIALGLSTLDGVADGGALTLYPDDEPRSYASAQYPGFQTDVVVTTSDIPAGAVVTLSVDEAIVATRTIGPLGDAGAQGAVFELVTVAPGLSRVAASVVDQTGATVGASADIELITTLCAVSVALEGGGCVVADADPEAPGVQAAFLVTHTGGDCAGATVSTSLGERRWSADAAFADGDAQTVTLTVDPGDAPIERLAHVSVAASHPVSRALNGTAELDVTVDTLAPAPSFLAPTGAELTLADDGDGQGDNGVQRDIVVRGGGADVARVVVTVGGADAGAGVPNGELWTFASHAFTADGEVALRATATDACGNAATVDASVVVWAHRPGVTLAIPGDGTLYAKDDGDPATPEVFETAAQVTITGAAPGMGVAILCTPPEGALLELARGELAEDVGAEASITFDLALDRTVLGASTVCAASITWHNSAVSVGQPLTIALPAPTLDLVDPADGALLATRAVTVSGAATGLDGRTVTVALRDAAGEVVAAASSAPVADGLWTATVGDAAVVDGAYDVLIDATDGYGNVVSATRPVAPRQIVIDATAPTVALVAPAGASLDPAHDPAAADVNPSEPGYQTRITWRVDGESAALGTVICLWVAGEAKPCQAPDEATREATWEVTLGAGSSTLSALARDAAGNVSSTVTATVALLIDAPTVTITAPVAGLVTTASTVDVSVHVADAVSGLPIDGATVGLLVDGAAYEGAPQALGAGDYLFPAVPLPTGASLSLRASATFASDPGVSPERVVVQKDVAPSVAITAPADGALFNLASAACLGTGVPCVTDVTVAFTELEPGAPVSLSVDCGAGVTTLDGTAADDGAPIVFSGVSLAHGPGCALAAEATDAAGQTATAAAIHVSVDRVAPSAAVIAPLGATLSYADDQKPGVAGMQSPLKLEVGGVEAGAIVTATMAWADEAGGAQQRTLTHTVATTTADGARYVATFSDAAAGPGLAQYPEGPVTLTFTLSDAAGNPASAARAVRVETHAPVARITSPAWIAGTACDASTPCAVGVCVSDTCWRPWGIADAKAVVVDVQGVFTAVDNVRICSDAAGLPDTAAACATPGTKALAVGSSAGGTVLIDLSAIPEGAQHLVAEVLPQAGAAWVPSTLQEDVGARRRAVYVDVSAPRVSAIESPSDSEAPVGVLNLAEQAASGRRYTIRLVASEDGPAAIYVNGQEAAQGVVQGGVAEVEVPLVEGANAITARVTDLVGNASAPDVTPYSPTVDTQPPTLVFTAPATSPIVAGAARDLRLASDAEGATVTLRDGGVEVASGAVAGGLAVFTHAEHGLLSDGAHTFTASVSDAAGNTTTVGTSPASVLVDTEPPTVAVSAPSDLATLTQADDAAPDTAAVDVATAFTPGDGATGWSIEVASCDPTTWDCATGSVAKSGPATPGEAVQATVLLTPTAAISGYRLRFVATDAVGNRATSDAHVTVIVQDCVVALSGLGEGAYLAASDCATGSGCQVALSATASGANCAAVDALALVAVDDGGGEAVIDTASDVQGGAASFAIEVADGDVVRLSVRALVVGTEVAASDVITRTVDLTPPSVTATPVVAGTAPALGLVNASNDDSAAPGYQISVAITAADAHLAGGRIVRLTRTVDGAEVELTPTNATLPVAISDGSVSFTGAHVELVDLSAQTVRVEVEDAAGNVASASFDLEVDATPPAAVVLAAIGADAVDAHAPSVALSWTAVGDDGQGGGPAAGYDVRYSKSPITDLSSFEAACAASELAHGAAVPAPAGPGSVEGYLVTGPDPRPDSNPCKFAAATDGSSWYFAVRAVDDAGNQGPIAAAGAASTADLTYRFSHLRFTTGAGFASTAFLGAGGTSIGDFDGDGATDLVAGFFLTNGFCLVQGGALGGDVTIDTKDGVGHHCVAGPASIVADAGAKELGSFIAALGDVNGDGRADFGVSGKTDDASGFIAVYLGRPASADPLGAPDVVIRGADATNSQYGSFCGAGRFGGGAVDALAVGEPGSDRIRVIPGDAAWTAGQATVVIDLDASGVELAHGIHTFEADFGAVAWFGIRCQAAGDVLPTPEGGPAADDLLVLQANNDDARVFVIPGRPLIPGEVGTLTKLDGALTAEDALAVRLRQDPKADGTYATGFGASFLGGRDATGDGVPDVIVAHGGRAASISGADGKALYVFDGAAIAAGQGGDLRVESAGATLVGRAWEGANGSVLRADPSSEFRSVAVIGDYDGWRLDGVATADVAIAGRDFAHVELRMNHEDAGGGAVLGMFPFREATLANPAAPGAGFSAGLWVDGGFDVEGDGRPDVLIGTARGEVLIVH